jgi:hypothetical protein
MRRKSRYWNALKTLRSVDVCIELERLLRQPSIFAWMKSLPRWLSFLSLLFNFSPSFAGADFFTQNRELLLADHGGDFGADFFPLHGCAGLFQVGRQ